MAEKEKTIKEEKKIPLTLWQKLVEIRKTIQGFYKDTKGFNYKYVSGSQVLEKIRPMMDELGILLVPNVEHNSNYEKIIYEKKNPDYVINCKMTYTWINTENPKEQLVCDWSLFGKQDDPSKAFGSGLTYSERYFLMKFFDIPTDDEDPDAKQGQAVVPVTNRGTLQQKTQPTAVATNTGSLSQTESNKDADNMKIEHGIDFCVKKLDELKKTAVINLKTISIQDIQSVGIDLQEFWNVTKDDSNYIKVRDTILVPEINALNQSK